MKASEIKRWVREQQPYLDQPEVYVREINSYEHDWDKERSKLKIAFVVPVEYSAAIANMGLSILYDILNNRRDDVICERIYMPEGKLLRRMQKADIPLFSKETFHQAADFDILAISSYYHLQCFAVPQLLELSGLKVWSKERDEKSPLVLFGGVAAFNPEPVADFIDAAFIGEGEDGIADIIAAVQSATEDGLTRESLLLKMQKTIKGIYVPRFYDFDYYPADDEKRPNQIRAFKALRDDVPTTHLKATVDLDKHKPLSKMFVSNSEGQEMSAGSVMIATGCSNRCRFCEGSFRTSPYRERTVEDVKEAFEELIMNTGIHAVTAYSFNLSDFYQVNNLIKWLLESEDRKVSMSSQRIDFFSEDFAKTAHISGNRSITLAIESGSQRMRDIINKNISEEQILKAFETAFKVGFARIKIYMIANLPFETDDDNKAFADLMTKVMALRDQLGATTMIRASWTPFQAKGGTPFQWAAGLPVGADGFPVFQKTLTATLARLKELGVKVRIGTDSKLSAVAQCISFGDRRMSQVIYNFFKSDSFSYKGGMSIGNKDPIADFAKELAKVGLDYKYFFRLKDDDETFPWDHIDIGIKKPYLLSEWHKAAKGVTTPSCRKKCTDCGICTDKNFEHFKPKKAADLTNIAEQIAATYMRKQVCKRLRIKVNVKDEFRYVHNSKIKMQLRRALFRAGVPIRDDIILASDKLKFQTWTYGTDYAEANFHTAELPPLNVLVGKMNSELFSSSVSSMSVTDPRHGANIRDKFDYVLYRMLVPSSVWSMYDLEKSFAAMLAKTELIVKMKVKGMQRGEWVTVDINARPLIKDMWASNAGDATEVRALIDPSLGVYETMPTIMGCVKRKVLAIPVERVEYLIKNSDGDFDMFASSCSVCGGDIELNIFGEQVDSARCARHLGDRA
jgi:radical SAM superfamily enzyme YgiQ (UPF0313 family)